MSIFAIMCNLRFQDILDILFLTPVSYYLFVWFQRTKAFKALIGLIVSGKRRSDFPSSTHGAPRLGSFVWPDLCG